ncbi:ABC transporter permease subunit [Latilactobacillus fuchuensis]|nr:ABC transporter permease subunit [Latilactobacillus fuchuensis]
MISIIRFEMAKIVKTKRFIGSLLISVLVLSGIFIIGFHYSQLGASEVRNQELGFNQLSRKKANAHAGVFNDQTVRLILADYIADYQNNSGGEQPFDQFSYNIANTFFPKDRDIYLEMIAANKKKQTLKIDQIKLTPIKKIGFSSFSKPLIIGSYSNWSELFKVTGSVFILISVLVIITGSTVFAEDTAKKMNQLLFITKYGRTKMLRAKIYTATVLSLFIFLVAHGLTFGYFYYHYYGMDGWNGSIQTNFDLKLFNFPLELNHFQIYLMILILQLASLLMIVGITLLISAIAKTPFSAVIIATGIFFLPKGLILIFTSGVLNKLLYLLPINLYDSEKMLTLMSAKQGFFFNQFNQNFIMTICILLLTNLISNCFTYYKLQHAYIE